MTEVRFDVLEAEECWAYLRGADLGRVASGTAEEIDVFPVNYVVDGASVVFRTAPGTKLVELTIRPAVAFEIDGTDGDQFFSVVVKGEARRLETAAEIEAAEALPLRPALPTVKEHFVRIVPATVTGRRFRPGGEPELGPEAYVS